MHPTRFMNQTIQQPWINLSIQFSTIRKHFWKKFEIALTHFQIDVHHAHHDCKWHKCKKCWSACAILCSSDKGVLMVIVESLAINKWMETKIMNVIDVTNMFLAFFAASSWVLRLLWTKCFYQTQLEENYKSASQILLHRIF